MKLDRPDDEIDRFASLRFVGDRFHGANLPLDFLDNISAYQRILRELAVEIWREKYPERARLPQGFREHLSLSFAEVSDGSADAKIQRDPYFRSSLPLKENQLDYLSLAQSRFIEISCAANDDKPVMALPHKLRSDLKLLVSEMSSSERLEVTSLSGKDHRLPSVRYSHVTRDRLLKAVRVPETKEVSGLGIVSGIDDPLKKLKLTTPFGVFSFPIERDRLRSEFGSALNTPVRFSALVRTTISGTAVVLEPLNISRVLVNTEIERLTARLNHIGRLKNGWRDGHADEISTKAMHTAKDVGGFISCLYDGIAAFPTSQGGINFEFSVGDIEVGLYVSADVITLECFDTSDADPKLQSFFAVTPRLLLHLSDIKAFMK